MTVQNILAMDKPMQAYEKRWSEKKQKKRPKKKKKSRGGRRPTTKKKKKKRDRTAKPAALGCACIRPRNLDCRHTSTSTTFYHEARTHTHEGAHEATRPPLFIRMGPVATLCATCVIAHTRGGSTLDESLLALLLAVKYPL